MKISDGLCYDDVLLVPQYSTIQSRDDVDISTNLGKGVELQGPYISANMKTVTGPDLAKGMSNWGSGILHRFDSIENQIENYKKSCFNMTGISVGINSEQDSDTLINETGTRVICIDVAHGDHIRVLNEIERIAAKYPNCLLIAGNVASGSGAKRLANAGADVVKAGIGGGCFAAGTRVLMSNGVYKNIEDIKKGDRVINKNGKPVNVTNAFSTGFKKVCKLRHTLSHKYTYVTPNHQYWVGDLNTTSKETISSCGYAKCLSKQSKTKPKANKIKWKQAGSLERDCLLMPRNISFEMKKHFEVKIIKRVGGNGQGKHNTISQVDSILKPSYELGYIFGTFLGDGWASCVNYKGSNRGSVSWAFGKNEHDIASKLKKCIKKSINKDLQICEKSNMLLCSLYYKPFADFLYTFGKRKNKKLPQQYLVDNKDYLKGLSDGLIDSDGHIEKSGRITFNNSSEYLIELFSVIQHIINGSFSNAVNRGKCVGGLGMNIDNVNDGYRSRVLLTASKRLTDDYQISKLLEINDTDLELEVFDITVDCDTHSFIANNAIVHNSLCTTRIETGNGVPQLSALEDCYNALKNTDTKIIADGGIKNSGDVVKALCFSHAVMLGSVLAGTEEAPGNVIEIDGRKYKEYAGSSTHKTSRVEGIAGLTPYKGSMHIIMQKFAEGLQSGLSYQGCRNLDELRESPVFVRISNAGLKESHPHANLK